MIRPIALALFSAFAVVAAPMQPASAAYEFYVRIQGPKGTKPPVPVSAHKSIAVIAYDLAVMAPRDVGTGHASGKRQWGSITIVKEPETGSATSALTSAPPSAPTGAATSPIRETVIVGCEGFDVEADYGKGPIRGALAAQSVDGLCIFALALPAPAANAIVRISLPDTPPGWSFNSQPQSKCVKSGETLDGTLSLAPSIFSFQWGPARTMAMSALTSGPCVKP